MLARHHLGDVTGAIDDEWETTPEAVAAALDGRDDGEGDDEALEIVDVRNPAAFREGHLPGSRNVPLAQLPTRVTELADADRVVTVCPHGKASLQAARIVASYEGVADARVESMAGGLAEWDGPLETGESRAGTVRDGPDTEAGADGDGDANPNAIADANANANTNTDADEGPSAPF
jgi:rhodanese-related sulfurtransferase